MSAPNHIIYALGMKVSVIERVFVPYRESNGTFPIFSEELQRQNGSPQIQNTENKVPGVPSVADAVQLVRAGGHRWRLKEHTSSQCNIYKPELIVIHEL